MGKRPCMCGWACACPCGTVISSSFKSCHRPDTPLSGGAFIRWLQMWLSSSPIIQREIGIVTLWGSIQRQNRRARRRLQSSAALRHLLGVARSHRFEIKWTSNFNNSNDNKPPRGNVPSLRSAAECVWRAGTSNLKCKDASTSTCCQGDGLDFYGDNSELKEQLSNAA